MRNDIISTPKPNRLVAIEALPPEMMDEALVDIRTCGLVLNKKDAESTRQFLRKHRVPLVNTGRCNLPRWKHLRELMQRLTVTAAD
jgi:hypothetical protein